MTGSEGSEGSTGSTGAAELAALLTAGSPGVHRLAPDVTVDDVRRVAADAGRPFVLLETVDDAVDLHRRLAAGLALPAWYGRNLDALADVVRDVDPGTVLLWDAWGRFAGESPRTFRVACELLGGALTVLLRSDAPVDGVRAPD